MKELKSPSSVAVIGIGRVGLPLALFLADAGHRVFGIDSDEAHIRRLQADRTLPFVEEGAQPLLEALLDRRFFPTGELDVVEQCETIIVTIGTPIDEHMNPILDPIERVFDKISRHLRRGQMILLRSTVSPETTEHLRTYLNEKVNLEVGREIHLAFCPERIAQGHSLEELKDIPQIVGGVTPASTAAAATFFEALGIATLPTDAVSAELAKLFCNMYRYIDFAIANEFMIIAGEYKRNIYEIIQLTNTGYKRGGIKMPGLTGGPCLYKDGFFLIERTPYPELISNAWKINESVPAYLIGRLESLGDLKGKRVGLMGLAFKKNNDDTRNSLSYKFAKILRRKGAKVIAHDPYLQADTLEEALKADILIFATNHDMYADWGLTGLQERCLPHAWICDPWNIFETEQIIFRTDAALTKPAEVFSATSLPAA